MANPAKNPVEFVLQCVLDPEGEARTNASREGVRAIDDELARLRDKTSRLEVCRAAMLRKLGE